ncbi:MAG TPA: TonB-dependent receptor [Planctomycetota bacterium]|nr:TonB-dependent receptor [Planctomycetota bacterium]
MSIEVRQVYGAAKREQSTLDAPASVSIITGEEIRARQYRTLDEVLAGLCGVYSTSDRTYHHTGVRGFFVPGDYNSRLLLLVDGHRLNDNIYGSAAVGREAVIDLDTIERVEFIRGPGSALYGSNAIFGVVNVITKSGADSRGFEGRVGTTIGDGYEAGLRQGGVSAGGIDYVVALRGFDSSGSRLEYDEYAATPSGGVTRDTDHENGYGFFARATRGELSLETGYVWREKGIPTGQYGTVFDDPDNRLIDAQGYFDLSWRRELGGGSELNSRVYYDDYSYKGWYVFDDTANGGPPDLLDRDDVIGRRIGAELSYGFDLGESQRIIVGSELRWNLQQDQRNYYPTFDSVDTHSHSVDWGAFVQDEISLGERTELVLGGRFDEYDAFGSTLNPRAALIHHPDERSAVKLLFGTAFRAPNVYESEYSDGSSYLANPDLDPEHITTYEVVGERFFGETARLSLSLYRYEVRDLIVQGLDTNSGALVFDNTDSVHANGVELEGAYALSDRWRVTLSQAFQDVEDDATGDRPANSPRRVTQARLEAELWDGACFASLEAIAVGSRTTLAGGEVDGYVLTNLSLRAPNIYDGVDLELACYNLFDESYSDPGSNDMLQDSLEQNGLQVAFRLRIRR